ncbi:hypothetical protein CCH79_00003114 [Gambusia affinis]|uniref:Uncharacterized protein n=1 Tax=Gambusia affinis TaxID=33528 RepID=A0A315VHF2_GAMAF|nr:hypothetical protein CCH79_00003114 [Gambusia affinis]
MEEVAEIVGVQISRDAFRPVPSGGVRLDLNAIDSAARGVLQGHVHPAEQLSGLVQADIMSSLKEDSCVTASLTETEPPGFVQSSLWSGLLYVNFLCVHLYGAMRGSP